MAKSQEQREFSRGFRAAIIRAPAEGSPVDLAQQKRRRQAPVEVLSRFGFLLLSVAKKAVCEEYVCSGYFPR